MSKQKMLEAQRLIKAQRYEDARAILITVDHPTADKWLERIDRFAGGNTKTSTDSKVQLLDVQITDRIGQRRSATIVFIVSLFLSPIGIGLIILPFALVNYFRHKRAVQRLQAEKVALLTGTAT